MSDLFDQLPDGQYPPPTSRREVHAARRGRRKNSNHTLRTGIILTILLGGLIGGGYLGYHHLQEVVTGRFFTAAADYEGPGDDPVEVVIPPGASGRLMGAILFDNEVVASAESFEQAFRNNPQSAGIQPGTYSLLTHMRAADAVAALVSGARIETMVTIPEGFTVAQILQRVSDETDITQADLEAALADPAAIGLPAVAEGNPEGWLFPATYRVEPTTTATSLLSDMVARTLGELDQRGVNPENREDVLIKASLVEREARHDEDRPKVARAILNRIDANMTLDIDAAVAYGLGISGTQLTRAHLADPENPFNTYQHVGLPPAPIANPGAASIEAVTHPADGPWLFWVTVNLATGETKFTETYAQHQQYVAELRAWQAANPGFGQPTDPAEQALPEDAAVTEPTEANE